MQWEETSFMTLLQQQQDTKSKKNVNLFYVCLMELSYFFLEHWRATPTCGRKHKNEFTFIFLKILFFLVFYLSENQCGTCWYLFPWKTFPQWSFGFLVLDVPFFPRYSQKLTWIIPRKVFVRKDTFLFLFSVARERMWEILICDPDIFLWKTLSVKFRFLCACLSLPDKYSQKLI